MSDLQVYTKQEYPSVLKDKFLLLDMVENWHKRLVLLLSTAINRTKYMRAARNSLTTPGI